ncbi:MAG TPA: FadR/GntR family transcriptional regulator [Rhizomicrobium sp.]|nr:FadR/GntR family transcriptional regulator [Rhizomicrobium sp.]
MASVKKRVQKKSYLACLQVPCSGHSEIAAVLGSEILSGARKPGSRMPSVDEMYETFGVSRVVLREVTKTLAAKGMVTAKTRVGTLVADAASWNWLDPEVLGWRAKLGMDFAFLEQITNVRRAVEPAAARLAAHNRSREDLQRMRAALEAMRRAQGNRRDFTAADVAFHAAVMMASGNLLFRAFAGVIEAALSGLLSAVSLSVFANRKNHAQAAERHAEILAAIERRDADAAARAMMRVIDKGMQHVTGLRKGHGREAAARPMRAVSGRKNAVALWM